LSSRFGAAAIALLFTVPLAQAADAPAAWARNDLEKLMVIGVSDPAQRPAFQQALLNGKVCALTDQKIPDDLASADPHKMFRIIGVQAPDGQPATPIFTAPERATETFPDLFPVCLQGGVLLAKLRGQRVVLDPGQPYGVLWTADELEHLLGIERTASIADVQFTTPEKPPAALVARLNEALSGLMEIKGAWLALAYWPERKEWAWFLEIHTTAQHPPLETLIDTAVQGIDMQGKPMDTSFLPPDAPPGKGIELFRR